MDNRLKRKNENNQGLTKESNVNAGQINVSDYYGISLEEVKIPEKILNEYEEKDTKTQIELLLKWIREKDSNQVISYKRFAVLHLRNLFKNYTSNMKKFLFNDDEIVRILMNDLLFETDQKIKFEVSYMLTKITYLASDSLCKIVCDADFIKDLLEITSNSCPPLIENVLIIIGNLIVDNKKYILENTNYLAVLKEIISTDKYTVSEEVTRDNNPTSLPVVILWNFNLIVQDLSNEEFLTFSDWIPAILKFFDRENLKTINQIDKNQEQVFQLVKIIYIFSNSDEMLRILLNNNLINHLIFLLQFINIPFKDDIPNKNEIIILSAQNLYYVIAIMNNVFAMENISLPFVQLNLFIEIFEHSLQRFRFNHKLDRKIICEIIWCLSNMATLPSDQVDLVCHSLIPQYILDWFMKDEKSLEQSLIFFTNALKTASVKGFVQILKNNFIRYLCNVFKSFNKNEIVRICLNIIQTIFKFCEHIMCEIDESNLTKTKPSTIRVSNIIIVEFEKHSLITRLEQLSIHNDEAISILSNNLLEEFEGMIQEMNKLDK